MKTLLLIAMFPFFLCSLSAQVLISNERPAADLTLKPRPVSIDTVFIVLKDKIVLGIRQEKSFDCIYEKTKLHEGNVFAGELTFYTADASGNYTIPVHPLAYRFADQARVVEPLIWSISKQD